MRTILLGIKSDPIENRYTYDWLFSVMNKLGITYMQMGGFYELPLVDERYFGALREKAEKYGIHIRSVFTAHRETHGCYSTDPYLEQAARIVYEKMIRAASLLGAHCMGSSIGSVPRDRMESKGHGTQVYFALMKDMMRYAKKQGLRSLSMEVMSALAEPPTLPQEIEYFMKTLGDYHRANRDTTVPMYVLGDTSHGYADQDQKVVHDNYALFEASIPHMCEFHFKNTDAIFGSTFGFSEAEKKKGVVDLQRVKDLLVKHQDAWPEEEMVGYLEHPGGKLGRDYSDYHLERMLTESVESIRKVFG